MCCAEIANKSSYGVFLGGSTRSTGFLHIRIRSVVAFSTGINFTPAFPFVLCGHVGNYLPSATKLTLAPTQTTSLLIIGPLMNYAHQIHFILHLHYHPFTFGSHQHIIKTQINHKASYAINLLFALLILITYSLLNIKYF